MRFVRSVISVGEGDGLGWIPHISRLFEDGQAVPFGRRPEEKLGLCAKLPQGAACRGESGGIEGAFLWTLEMPGREGGRTPYRFPFL